VISADVATKGARSRAIVSRSEKGDCAITPRMRGSSAAAWRATAAPSEDPKRMASSAWIASSAPLRSRFS